MFKLIKENKFASLMVSVALAASLGAGGVLMAGDENNEEIKNYYTEMAQTYEVADDSSYDVEANQYVPKYDFEALQAQYPDLIGYLEGDLLPEPLPVMRDSISDPYYMDRLPDGSYGSSVFAEADDLGKPNSISILGGHNLDSVLGNLDQYQDEANFGKPLYLHTKDTVYEFDLADVRKATSLEGGLVSDAYMDQYGNSVKESSIADTNIDIKSGDSVVNIFCCVRGTLGAYTPERMVFDFVAKDMYKQVNDQTLNQNSSLKM